MNDHKQILRDYNAWRRDETGGKTLEDFGITPKMVGEAIDALLGFDYWQAECLKKGFEYVRESDDHYVVASPAEMVALLRDILGVDIRQKDSGDYGVSVAELESQVDGLVNTIHSLESLRKDAARYAWLRDHYHGFEHYRADKNRPGAFEREIDDQIAVQSWQPKGKPGNG